jgi:SNF2 family DNA or RNA helicase
MGLGKSLCAIATHMCDLEAGTVRAPLLIVCPKSLIDPWIGDCLHKFFPGKLRILVFRREFLEERWNTLTSDELHSFDVVLTNYETVSSVAVRCSVIGASAKERKKKDVRVSVSAPASSHGGGGLGSPSATTPSATTTTTTTTTTTRAAQPPATASTGSSLLFQVDWHRIIADESQKFTNADSACFQSMCKLRSRRRVCLTGTPYRNYDRDLLSQFRWLGYSGTHLTKEWDAQRFRAHRMDRCVLLMDYDSANIVLPAKKTQVQNVEMEGHELLLYHVFASIIRLKAQRNTSDAIVILGLLRQLCVAPFLVTPTAASQLSSGSMSAAEKRSSEPGFNSTGKFSAFDGVGAASSSDKRLSPMLVTLGKLCTRDEYLAAMRRVTGASRRSSVVKVDRAGAAAPPLSSRAIEHLAFQLDEWVSDRTGSAGIDSSKMREIRTVISRIPSDEKVLVFSNFDKATRLLFQSMRHFGAAPQSVCVVTGNVKMPDRINAFRRFRCEPTCRVLIMTYGVGSSGLNLQEATHVIHADPWWNSLDQKQAVCRAHRIGQTRSVTEYYVLVSGSIEQKIRHICSEKEKNADAMLKHSSRDGKGGAPRTAAAAADTEACTDAGAAVISAGGAAVAAASPQSTTTRERSLLLDLIRRQDEH